MKSAEKVLTEQRRLLQIEYEADKEAFRQQTDRLGIDRLVRRGDAWFPIRFGRTYYNSLNQRVIEIYRDGDTEAEHNLDSGKPILFFATAGSYDNHIRHLFSATICYVEGNRLVAAIPDGADTLSLQMSDTECGVQLSFDETTYRLMFDAIDRTLKATGRLAYLRDLFYSHRHAETFSFDPLRFPYLNRSQEQAVNLVLRAKDVAIVHGPPGTGKTTTLVEAIYETLRRERQVLVCAQSNMAVDWISEKLMDRGVSVMRLGNPSRVNDKMLSFTYERLFEAHPDYPELWGIRKAIRQLYSGTKRADERRHQKIESLKSKATELEIRINSQLFEDARVIACTLTRSANRLLDGKHFSSLFIDEAAQALEAACWIPMRRVGRVILAGDHCQLPPTVKTLEAMKAGLGLTLMERIVDNHPDAVSLLKTQYRMHRDIMRFPSHWFYNGEVEAAPEVENRGILDFDTPIQWIDTAELMNIIPESETVNGFREEETFNGEGRFNLDEAMLTVRTLENYIERIGKQRFLEERLDVGVISPYKAQTFCLRKLIKKSPVLKPFAKFISVNTVDGFQGQERDIIIISLVRSNDSHQIGFLRDLRRMNVAMTRARMKLIIIGNPDTLSAVPFYRQLLTHIKSLHQ